MVILKSPPSLRILTFIEDTVIVVTLKKKTLLILSQEINVFLFFKFTSKIQILDKSHQITTSSLNF